MKLTAQEELWGQFEINNIRIIRVPKEQEGTFDKKKKTDS